jgi:hypothetical protein
LAKGAGGIFTIYQTYKTTVGVAFDARLMFLRVYDYSSIH